MPELGVLPERASRTTCSIAPLRAQPGAARETDRLQTVPAHLDTVNQKAVLLSQENQSSL